MPRYSPRRQKLSTAHPLPWRHGCRPRWPGPCTTPWRPARWPRRSRSPNTLSRSPVRQAIPKPPRMPCRPSMTWPGVPARQTGASTCSTISPSRHPRGALPAYDCARSCSALKPSSNSATPAPSPKPTPSAPGLIASVIRCRAGSPCRGAPPPLCSPTASTTPPIWHPGLSVSLTTSATPTRSGSATSSAGNWPASPASVPATAGCGSDQLCGDLYQLLTPYSGTQVGCGAWVAYCGAVDYYLGLLAAAQGDRTTATGHLDAATAQHLRLGAPRWAALGRRQQDRQPHHPNGGNRFRRDGPVWAVTYGGV